MRLGDCVLFAERATEFDVRCFSLSPIPDGGIAKASMNNACIITTVMMSVACTRPETR